MKTFLSFYFSHILVLKNKTTLADGTRLRLRLLCKMKALGGQRIHKYYTTEKKILSIAREYKIILTTFSEQDTINPRVVYL